MNFVSALIVPCGEMYVRSPKARSGGFHPACTQQLTGTILLGSIHSHLSDKLHDE